MTEQNGYRITLAKIKIEPQEDETSEAANERRQPQQDKCSVCWIEPPVNAIKLECSHVFCFLCIKSAAAATNKCPLCRADITKDFNVGDFELVGSVLLPRPGKDLGFWFYEGRRGWWMYDADTSAELEEAQKIGWKKVQRLIAGQVYVIHLVKMKQYQKGYKERSRAVRRSRLDRLDGPILGLAGLRDRITLTEIRKLQRHLLDRKLDGSLDVKAEPASSEEEETEDLRF